MIEPRETPELVLPAKAIHELLLRQSLERPSAIAIECAGETIDYGELMRRSRAFAAGPSGSWAMSAAWTPGSLSG